MDFTWDKYAFSILLSATPVLLLSTLLCLFMAFLKKNKKNVELQERIIFEDGLTPNVADRLICLIRTRQWLLSKNYLFGTRERRKYKTNMEELCQHEFFMIRRWMIQLELAKGAPDPDVMVKELDQVIDSMKEHAGGFKLSDQVQHEILHLCRQLPERTFRRKYDNYFDVNCV